jgi:hypothetical protein
MFDWSIYIIFVLNTGWKRDSLQMMIFVNVCSTWSIIELKTRFETWITRKFVSHSLFNNTYGLPVFTKDTKCPNQVFYVWLFDLQTICVKYTYVLETWFSRNDDIRKSLLVLKHVWTKNAFWDVNNKKWRKWCKFVSPFLFNNICGLACSQWAPHIQVKFFMCDWSIYRLFVLNGGWKLDSLQIMLFVYVCSTWGIVELKMRFETWITRNDVNGVSLFHFSYLTTLIAYMCSQIKFFMSDWSF